MCSRAAISAGNATRAVVDGKSEKRWLGVKTQRNKSRAAFRVNSANMTYVIAGSCIKDDSCIEVCPVDCIHPKPGDPDFETAEQLYIDPAVCIDCDACVEACPVDAVFPEFDVPEKFGYALELNAEFFAEQNTIDRTAA